MTLAKKLKAESNRNKIELGIVLLELQTLLKECEFEGIEDFGTFRSNLAELHLSLSRVIQLLRNSKFVLDEAVPLENYKELDSSVLDLIRRNKKHPQDYLDDIRGGVSYSDLTKEL
jgi:hypothetical protein